MRSKQKSTKTKLVNYTKSITNRHS